MGPRAPGWGTLAGVTPPWPAPKPLPSSAWGVPPESLLPAGGLGGVCVLGLGGIIWNFFFFGWGGAGRGVWGVSSLFGEGFSLWGFVLGMCLVFFFKFGGGVFVWGVFDGLFLFWGTDQEGLVFVLFWFFFLTILPI